MTDEKVNGLTVRPFGKYGHIYLLTPLDKSLYRLLSIFSYIIIFTSAILQFFLKGFYLKVLKLPPDFPLLFALIWCGILFAGQIKLSERGRIISGVENAGYLRPKINIFFIALGFISSLFIVAMSFFTIYLDLHNNTGIESWQFILFIFGIYSFFYTFKRLFIS